MMFDNKFGNERDVEVPTLLEFVRRMEPKSLVDIGGFDSHKYYAKEVRELVEKYHAVDIVPDPETGKIVDRYHVSNAKELSPYERFDVALCISTLEHAGISTYKEASPIKERAELFRSVMKFSNHILFTFPVGPRLLIEGQMEFIDNDELDFLLHLVSDNDFKYSMSFAYCSNPSGGGWITHKLKRMACDFPYQDGVMKSICLLELHACD